MKNKQTKQKFSAELPWQQGGHAPRQRDEQEEIEALIERTRDLARKLPAWTQFCAAALNGLLARRSISSAAHVYGFEEDVSAETHAAAALADRMIMRHPEYVCARDLKHPSRKHKGAD